MEATHRCRCGAEADVVTSDGRYLCRIHQTDVPAEERTTLYEIRSDFPDIVGYLN